jgi:hypothetical protein
MAQTLKLAGGAEVKIRSPLGAFLLAIVTLGIYYWVWYYKINRELRDFGIDVRPGIALLAITLGGILIVPPFVSIWRTFKRIKEAQKQAGLEEHVNHVLGFILFLIAVILLPVEIPYAQSHLNRLWRAVAGEDEKRGLGMRGEAPA